MANPPFIVAFPNCHVWLPEGIHHHFRGCLFYAKARLHFPTVPTRQASTRTSHQNTKRHGAAPCSRRKPLPWPPPQQQRWVLQLQSPLQPLQLLPLQLQPLQLQPLQLLQQQRLQPLRQLQLRPRRPLSRRARRQLPVPHNGGKTVGRVCAVTGPMWQDLSKARNKPPICWWFIPAIYGKIEDGFPTLSHIPKSNELASCFLLNLLFGEYTVYPIFTYTQVVCVDPGTMGIFRDAKDADSLGNLSPVCTSGSLLQGCWVLLGRTGGRATLEG